MIDWRMADRRGRVSWTQLGDTTDVPSTELGHSVSEVRIVTEAASRMSTEVTDCGSTDDGSTL
jgi:hypothetical protein